MGKRFQRLAKRCLDVGAASAGLVALAPVLAGTAAAVKWKLGSPVLFRQPRPGQEGRIFELLKFRTMRIARPGEGIESDKNRLTALGQRLREWSLDELPTLLNVLRGEMSLVGPRPLLVQYLARYNPTQARRHEVKPGITGWAQINGRNQLSWEDKFEHDVWYVDHWSLALDLRILLMTMLKVVRREGIQGDGSATMTEFTGGAPD